MAQNEAATFTLQDLLQMHKLSDTVANESCDRNKIKHKTSTRLAFLHCYQTVDQILNGFPELSKRMSRSGDVRRDNCAISIICHPEGGNLQTITTFLMCLNGKMPNACFNNTRTNRTGRVASIDIKIFIKTFIHKKSGGT